MRDDVDEPGASERDGAEDPGLEDARRAAWAAAAARYRETAEPWTSQAGPAILAVCRLGPRSEFLDLGCGAGAIAAAAQSLGALATGVDIAPGMVAVAQARPGGRETEFKIGDARALDAREGAFDAVAANFSVLETGAPERTLREAYRALRPGGRLAWTCWPGPSGGRLFEVVEGARLKADPARPAASRGLEEAAAAALTEAAGFAPVETLRLALYGRATADGVLAAAEALDATAPKTAARAAAESALSEALEGQEMLVTEAVLVVAEKPGGVAGRAASAAEALDQEAARPARGGLFGRLAGWLRRR